MSLFDGKGTYYWIFNYAILQSYPPQGIKDWVIYLGFPMITESKKSLPILAIEIGSLYTHAFLFDRGGDHNGFSGKGSVRSTIGQGGRDVRIGVQMALEELQADSGHILLDAQKSIIRPSPKFGVGVNHCILSISASSQVKVSILNLQKNLPLQAANQLTSQLYYGKVQVINFEGDKRRPLVLDKILSFRPDLLIINSPTDILPDRIDLRQLETLYLAILLLPENIRPVIIYLGNPSLGGTIQEIFAHYEDYYFDRGNKVDRQAGKPNFLMDIVNKVTLKCRIRRINGLEDLVTWLGSQPNLSTEGFQQLISQLYMDNPPSKGVVGLNISSEYVTLNGAIYNQERIIVNPLLGRSSISGIDPEENLPQKLSGWLMRGVLPEREIITFLWNKKLFPYALPLSEGEADLQSALIRNTINQCTQDFISMLPVNTTPRDKKYLPAIEPILISGSWATNLISPGEICMMVVDGLQPTGVTTILLDKFQIASVVGSVVSDFPLLSDLLINAYLFQHLATVVSLVGDEPFGTPILRARVIFDDGRETSQDLKQGQLDVIPLPLGKSAEIQLQPYYRYDIGMGGPGRGGVIRVTGSILGVVLDGRGRPLKLLEDPDRRAELFRKWLWTLGG